jgi:sugar (pentulose or hexulose) kinase
VTVLPQLGGERSPGWRAAATGAVSGLTLSTTAEDVVQGAFEGISYRFAEIFDRLARTSATGVLVQGNPSEVVGTGRALVERPKWAQLLADVLAVPVTLSAVPEASARGAALVALGRIDLPAPLGARFEPRPERTAAHREARARQQALYDATAAPTS